MDVQTIFAVNLMAISALVLLAALLQRRRELASFALVNLAVVAVGGVALAKFPDDAGTIVALAFLPLVGAPATLWALQARGLRLGQLDSAARYAGWAALLHPTPAMRLSAALARAGALPDLDERAQAIAALAKQAPAHQAPMIEALLLAERGAWEELLAYSARPETGLDSSALRLRALGELGRVDELMAEYERIGQRMPLEQTVYAWLFALAFGGRAALVGQMLQRTLRLDDQTSAYWRAVAQGQAGDADAARRALATLAATEPRTQAARAAGRRLAAPGGRPDLSPQAQATLARVAARVASETARRTKGWRLARATLALIACNFILFFAEIALGGSTNTDTLIALGALYAPLVLADGEAWRLLSAAFLHYGELHFALNMLMLALIGREVEPDAGPLATFLVYLFGALVSSGVVLTLMARGDARYTLYVGASGAIFALFGVVGAFRISDWLRHRASLDAWRVAALGFAMLIQIGADYLLPMSSLAAHLSGFVFGLIAGALIAPRRINTHTRIGIST